MANSIRLFTSVPSNALNGPTIQALLALYDNYVLDCTVTEVPTPQKNAENDAFLNAMMVTSVMQQAHTFLASKGLADADPIVFAEYLRTIWMGFYNRGGGINSSSGLEHVFLGEMAIRKFRDCIRGSVSTWKRKMITSTTLDTSLTSVWALLVTHKLIDIRI